jgi:hypothetical protein
MADITSSVGITGSHQHNTRPFGWHVWKIHLPSAVLTASQVDDVVLPDRFDPGTVVFDVKVATTKILTIATTCVYDVERARILRSDNATIDEKANLIAGNDLETLDTTGIAETSGVVINDWSDTEANGGLTPASGAASLYQGCINIEFTPVGAITAGTSEVHVALLLGRIEY